MPAKTRKPGDPPATKTARADLDQFLSILEAGESQAEALRVIGRNFGWLAYWIHDDWFRPQWELAKERSRVAIAGKKSGEKLGFVDFRSTVLGRHTFEHMKQWAEWFETDDNDHILILCPPETAKTTFVLDYILWRIYLDTNIQVGYVSKSLPHSIKQTSKLKN